MKERTVDGSTGAPRYAIGVLGKAFDLLDILETEAPLTLTELSKRAGTNKVTVLRILANLETRGYVERDEFGRYVLGVRLLQLGLRKSAALDLRAVAHPYLLELRSAFDETVNLGVPSGNGILYIDIIESSLGLRMAAAIGARDSLHSTAIGKAIAANRVSARRAALDMLESEPKTARTIATWADLDRELALVQARGYAIDDEENESGARCIGVPLFDYAGTCIGAISVSGPVTRMNDARVLEIAERLTQVATTISGQLGYRG